MSALVAPPHNSPGAGPAVLELFGALRLAVDGAMLPIRSRKSRALLAYLALSPQGTESRSRLAGLLWSEKTDRESQVSLRQQLMGLRRDLDAAPTSLLGADRLNIALDHGAVTSDIARIFASVEAGEVPEILLDRRNLTDEFLKDLDDLDPAFDYWRAIQRESFREQLLRRLTAQLGPATKPDLAFRAALAVRNLDPTNEQACRALMRHYAGHGDTAAALRLYSELWTLLDTEFDMEPADETQALVAQIKLSDQAGPAPEPQAASPMTDDPTGPPQTGHVLLFVEPFQNEDLDEIANRRVAGLRQELLAALTRFRDWSVREATGTETDIPAERKAYDIAATAFEEDGELFLTLTLRRHADRTYLWSQRVGIRIDRWQATKLAIVRRIASSLDVHISAERLTRTATLPDGNLDVYDRWLRANGLIYRWQPRDEVRAEAIFRSILADTNQFAPAFVGLVQVLNTCHHIFPGILRDSQRAAEALGLAKAAVKLDPLDSRTQLCLAWSHILNENYPQATLAYELALQMNENDPWTLTSCAQGLSYCDDKVRARRVADRALDVAIGGAPIHWSYQMCIRFLDADYRGAVEAADNAEGSAFFVPAWKAASLAHLREYAAARDAIERFYTTVAANWHGQSAITPRAVMDWFSQSFPIRNAADRERLQAGVTAAGLLDL